MCFAALLRGDLGSHSGTERGGRSEEDWCDGTSVRPDDVLRGRGGLGLRRGLREGSGGGERGGRHDEGWCMVDAPGLRWVFGIRVGLGEDNNRVESMGGPPERREAQHAQRAGKIVTADELLS